MSRSLVMILSCFLLLLAMPVVEGKDFETFANQRSVDHTVFWGTTEHVEGIPKRKPETDVISVVGSTHDFGDIFGRSAQSERLKTPSLFPKGRRGVSSTSDHVTEATRELQYTFRSQVPKDTGNGVALQLPVHEFNPQHSSQVVVVDQPINRQYSSDSNRRIQSSIIGQQSLNRPEDVRQPPFIAELRQHSQLQFVAPVEQLPLEAENRHLQRPAINQPLHRQNEFSNRQTKSPEHSQRPLHQTNRPRSQTYRFESHRRGPPRRNYNRHHESEADRSFHGRIRNVGSERPDNRWMPLHPSRSGPSKRFKVPRHDDGRKSESIRGESAKNFHRRRYRQNLRPQTGSSHPTKVYYEYEDFYHDNDQRAVDYGQYDEPQEGDVISEADHRRDYVRIKSKRRRDQSKGKRRGHKNNDRKSIGTEGLDEQSGPIEEYDDFDYEISGEKDRDYPDVTGNHFSDVDNLLATIEERTGKRPVVYHVGKDTTVEDESFQKLLKMLEKFGGPDLPQEASDRVELISGSKRHDGDGGGGGGFFRKFLKSVWPWKKGGNKSNKRRDGSSIGGDELDDLKLLEILNSLEATRRGSEDRRRAAVISDRRGYRKSSRDRRRNRNRFRTGSSSVLKGSAEDDVNDDVASNPSSIIVYNYTPDDRQADSSGGKGYGKSSRNRNPPVANTPAVVVVESKPSKNTSNKDDLKDTLHLFKYFRHLLGDDQRFLRRRRRKKKNSFYHALKKLLFLAPFVKIPVLLSLLSLVPGFLLAFPPAATAAAAAPIINGGLAGVLPTLGKRKKRSARSVARPEHRYRESVVCLQRILCETLDDIPSDEAKLVQKIIRRNPRFKENFYIQEALSSARRRGCSRFACSELHR